jgi:pimeloyl-ACP methyl ester carboxylesterase
VTDPLGLVGVRSRAVEGVDVAGEASADRGPGWARSLGELTSPLAAGRLLAATPRLARAPRGSGVVVDVPGWQAPELSGAPLRAYLRHLGYDARGWGFGTNTGRAEQDTARLADSVVGLSEEHGPVALVGWSLGGVLSREVARRHPEHVRRVITYGTPVVGGPSYTAVARAYAPEIRDRVARLARRLDADQPIRVPLTVLFSRRDGIVAWRACLDQVSPDVEHVEVRSTHIGMGVDPDVWGIVADRLAR